MMLDHQFPRRTFLKTGLAAAAGSFILPRFSIAKSGPGANSRVNVAMIGAGGIASMAYLGLKDENIVALCDVDSTKFGEHAERFPDITRAKTFKDFRVMLDKLGHEIDAVVIGTPDHTHFVATMDAMQRGKHVYTQKPLTHSLWECRTLKKAKDKYKLVTCMGNQGHASDGIRQMKEWIDADVFGQISRIDSWQTGGGWGVPVGTIPTADRVPDTLDWDLWLGPAPQVPFYRRFHPLGWRRWRPFGAGMLGDWFPHIADGPVWGLDLYDPIAIEAEVSEEGSEWLTPKTLRIRWDFAARGDKAPCSLFWHNGEGTPNPHIPSKPTAWTWDSDLPSGSLYHGSKAMGFTDNRSSNPRLANKEQMKAFKEAGYPAEKYPRVPSKDPFKEWAAAIKGTGPEPGSNFDYASKFTEVQLLGVLAGRFGGRIEWDSANFKVTNRPELNQYLKDPIRDGWVYGTDLWT